MKTVLFALVFQAIFVMPLVQTAWGQTALEKLEKEVDKALSTPDTESSAAPGYLGLFADDATDGRRGVQVISVKKGGPAETSGLKAGDRIVAVDRGVIATTDDMAAALEKGKAGDKLLFEIVRGDTRLSTEVTLGIRPKDDSERSPALPPKPEILPEPGRPAAGSPRGRAVLGVSVLPITDDARSRFGLVVRSGALIGTIRPGSPAEQARLPVGGVIVAVDGRRVDSPENLITLLAAARPSDNVEITFYVRERLYRTSVRLAATSSSVASPTLPRTRERSLRLGPLADDLPALRKIEGIIDRFVPPRADTGDPRDVAALKEQIEVLRLQVEQLQQRVKELEGRRGE